MTEKKVHGNTRKAADMALAKRLISRSSHEAILAGTLTLEEARKLGRDRGPYDTGRASSGSRTATERTPEGRERPQEGTGAPPQPVSRISKDDSRQLCWCGCEELTSPNRKWKPGHDQRGKGIITRAVKEGKVEELSLQLREYAEERGLLR
jgi:hypothetical protein